MTEDTNKDQQGVPEEEKASVENTPEKKQDETPEEGAADEKVSKQTSETPEKTETTEKSETTEKPEDKPSGSGDGGFFDEKKPAEEVPEILEKVLKIGRVSKVVKGGKNFSFNALVVVGDGRGSAGIGFGKSNDVVGAITKGTSDAKRNYKKVLIKDGTIPHEIIGEFKAARVIMRPAGAGTGVIAGGPVRALCDAVGIRNILTKSLGSRNPVNVVKATMDGFLKLRLERRG